MVKLTPEQHTERGKELIDIFKLKPKANGRVTLLGGDKSPEGVSRTVERVFREFEMSIAPEEKETTDE